jgi:DNA-binding CsgD family transcriptional regulator
MKYMMRNQYLNYLSIDLLDKLGNHTPQQKQIDLMHSILTKISITQHLSFDHQLTERETSCLYWAAMGKTSKETAELLQIQPNTVEQYRKAIKRKLYCKSMAEAVFKGIRLGYMQSFLVR